MTFIDNSAKTNWKFIGIVAILVVLVGGGILSYYYSWIKELEIGLVELEVKLPEVKVSEEMPPVGKPIQLKNKIAFVTQMGKRVGNRTIPEDDIYLINPDGTSQTKVIDNPENSGLRQLSWSLSGNYLAWIRNNSFEYVKSSDLKRNSVSTIDPKEGEGRIVGYAFSFDEKKIALLEAGDPPATLPSERTSMTVRIINLAAKRQLYEFRVIEGSGGENERIHPNKHIDWLDSNTVVTVFKQNGKFSISTFNLDKGIVSKIDIATFNNFPDPFTISRNRTIIAYWKAKDNREKELWVSDLNGNNKEKLTSLDEGIYIDAVVREIRFSPDNKFLAYVSNIAESVSFTIFNFSSDKVTDGEINGLGFDWKPDSKQLVSINGLYSSNLVILGVDGKKIEELTSKDSSGKILYGLPVWFPQ